MLRSIGNMSAVKFLAVALVTLAYVLIVELGEAVWLGGVSDEAAGSAGAGAGAAGPSAVVPCDMLDPRRARITSKEPSIFSLI